jgi:hypothetical protein
MDQELLVDTQVEDGEKLLSHLVRSGFDVTVAFWVLTGVDRLWFLYIASDTVDPTNIGKSYGKLNVALTQMSQISVSLSDVKLVHPSNPIARDAIALRDRKPARLPMHYRGKRLGDLSIEEAYIYPKIGPMTRDEVRQTFMALIGRNGPAQPTTFTLADGSIRQAVPIGMHLQMAGQARGLQFELYDPTTGQTQAVPADEVVSIQ